MPDSVRIPDADVVAAARDIIEKWADKKLGKGNRPCGWPNFGSIAVDECAEMLADALRARDAEWQLKLPCGHPASCLVEGEPQPVEHVQHVTHDMAMDACEPEMEGDVMREIEWMSGEPVCGWCKDKKGNVNE